MLDFEIGSANSLTPRVLGPSLKPIHERYEEVIREKEQKLEQKRYDKLLEQIAKDPLNHGMAPHQPTINPESKRILENKGVQFVDVLSEETGGNVDMKRQIFKDFIKSSEDWQKK